MTCDSCGKRGARTREISRTYGKGKDLLLIEKVPVIDCPHCDESYMTAETLHEIERIKLHRRSFAVKRPIQVAALKKIEQEDLRYEESMFRTTAKYLKEHSGEKTYEVNAFLESFLIHTRNLLDFLHPQQPKDGDVLAQDFFDDPMTWKRLRPKLSGWLSSQRARIDKELAHLTYSRLSISKEKSAWRFLVIAEEVIQLLDVFRREVPQNGIATT